jgi:hypothetical protein
MGESDMLHPRTVTAIGVALALAACATQPTPSAYDPPGFFLGLFHRLVSPFALVAGLFSETRVYAFPNTGWFYDLGFMLGLLPWGGTGAAAR